MADFVLHEDPRSGNCYKIKLTAALLGVPIDCQQYDIMKGETRTEHFLGTVSSNGRIPVLEIRDGDETHFLPESNAACWYLADGSKLIPQDRYARADMLRWMFFEQYSHEPNVATMRFWLHFVGREKLSDQQKAQMMAKRVAGSEALRLMDDHLSDREWFVGEGATLADIVLFAYTHVAEDGGFKLSEYPAIQRWIDRVAALPDYRPMA